MFATIAPRLVDNGWPSPLPVSGKRPIVAGWDEYTRRPVDAAQLEAWCRQFPGAGVGHAAGHGLAFVDEDILDADLALTVDEIAEDILGPTPAVRVGRAPKRLRVYRGSGIRSRKRHPIELFGDSGQCVFYGTHPETGLPYTWIDEEPLHLSPDELPTITTDQVERFLAAAEQVIQATAQRHGQPVVDLDLFRRLRGERSGKRGRAWLLALAHQLRAAEPGTLHNTLLSVVLALVNVGFTDAAIRAFIRKHFAAPRSGPYAAAWKQVDPAIRGARKRRQRTEDTFESRVLQGLGT